MWGWQGQGRAEEREQKVQCMAHERRGEIKEETAKSEMECKHKTSKGSSSRGNMCMCVMVRKEEVLWEPNKMQGTVAWQGTQAWHERSKKGDETCFGEPSRPILSTNLWGKVK